MFIVQLRIRFYTFLRLSVRIYTLHIVHAIILSNRPTRPNCVRVFYAAGYPKPHFTFCIGQAEIRLYRFYVGHFRA